MAKTKKVTSKTKLSPKIAKADKLRLEANEKGAKMRAVVNKWMAEVENEKDAKKQISIDAKYKRLLDVAEEAEDKAYKEYHDYVNKNFSKEDIGTAVRKGIKTGKGFMGKTFITSLDKLQKGGRK